MSEDNTEFSGKSSQAGGGWGLILGCLGLVMFYVLSPPWYFLFCREFLSADTFHNTAGYIYAPLNWPS